MDGKPRKAKAQQNCDAWWYSSPTKIEIYIHTNPNGPTVTCSLTKQQLIAYLRRAGNPK